MACLNCMFRNCHIPNTSKGITVFMHPCRLYTGCDPNITYCAIACLSFLISNFPPLLFISFNNATLYSPDFKVAKNTRLFNPAFKYM